MSQQFAAEEWRQIEGHPGYEVSNYGRLRSWLPLRNGAPAPSEPRIIKPAFDRYGYAKCILFTGGLRGYYTIHVLVCVAWHGPKASPEMCVRHLDGNRSNNRVENLAWGTPKENSADSKVHGTWVRGEKVNTAKLNEDEVRAIRRETDTCVSVAERYGVTFATISHIRSRRTWKHVE